MTSALPIPAFADVLDAAARIRPHAHVTPMLRSTTLDAMSGARLHFKCENQQRVGAFKFRGACNAVFALDETHAARGVVTHSSGNHGAALALAAKLRGIPARIVVPDNAIASKVANIRRYGAHLTFCAPNNAAREATAQAIIDTTGGSLVHPFENLHVMAGQGTAALELLRQADGLDVLLAPVGGGGLMAGTCIAARALHADIELFAAEPEGADDAYRGLSSGVRVKEITPDTACDGLRTPLGEPNFAVLQRERVQVLRVSDAECATAQELVLDVLKQRIEISCATVLAAVLRYPQHFAGKRVGLILTGGNVG